VLTPVINATNNITTYSATFTTTPGARVLRRNSVIISPPKKLLDCYQLAPEAAFQQWLVSGMPLNTGNQKGMTQVMKRTSLIAIV
jgi:hypothetical protein